MLINKISKCMNTLAFLIVLGIFVVVGMVGLFVQANYDFADFPYFQWSSFGRYLLF